MSIEDHQSPRDDRSGTGHYVGWLTLILAFSLPVYRPWVTLASTLIMVSWWFGGGLGRRIETLRHHRLTIAILVFIGINLVSLAWSSNPEDGLIYVLKYRYLLLIPMLATATPSRFRRWATTGFEAAAALSVVLSILVFLGVLRFGGAHPGNPSPIMAHLDYSLLLALASLLAFALGLYSDSNPKRRLMWLGTSLFLVFGLLVNIGRSGQVAFVAGLTALLLYWFKQRSARQFFFAAASTGTVLGLLVIFSPTFSDRAQTTREEVRSTFSEGRYDTSVGGRIAALIVTGDIVRDHPLLGTGVGDNIPALRDRLDTTYPQFKSSIYWYPHFHNQYAQTVTEIGLIGLAALGWIFWELVRGRYRRREIGAAAVILATVYLVGFLGEPFFRKQIPLIAFALFAGLISAEKLDSSSEETETRDGS